MLLLAKLMVILHNNNLIFYKMSRSLAKNMEVEKLDEIYIYIYIYSWLLALIFIWNICWYKYEFKTLREVSGSVNLTINTIAADTLFLVLILTKRNRTSTKDTGYYGLHLCFLALSYRNTAKALSRFVKQSHVVIWKWI